MTTTITVRRESAAQAQVHLHILAAVARAVLDHTVSAGPPPVPQITPAGLGVCTPARARADTSGSVQAARLGAAAVAAAVTGSARDQQRVLGWQRQLSALDAYQAQTAQERHETGEAQQQRLQLERASRRGAREALAGLERYLAWLERHIAATPDERVRLEVALLICAGAMVTRALLIAAGLSVDREPLQIRARLNALEAREQLEAQHANRDRLLASARARVAGSRRAVGPTVRMPGACYTVTVSALVVQTAAVTLTVPAQHLDLDLRAGVCTTEQFEALKAVRDAKNPIRTEATGHMYRRGDIPPHVWAAWCVLAAMVQGQVLVVRQGRELAA